MSIPFDEDFKKYTLSNEEKAEILHEIKYEDDIDVEWNGYDDESLKILLPKLYEKFGVFRNLRGCHPEHYSRILL